MAYAYVRLADLPDIRQFRGNDGSTAPSGNILRIAAVSRFKGKLRF